ncbi:SIS domain-containing protein [Streptomyces oceani]|uniref:Mannose-6-phosphate isomerase n=1 Tax=Streptomyces oceani TaxID=1075402 RepID=A0A1E7KNJ2_9ACTN|nr:SIS domain-containing protein [Streptomyces oceani]OEV05477.1 mannose-6-phosphate isomerase [Streptomyces oceani]
MLDESVLDVPDALARADTHGLLHGAAESGARTRTAMRLAEEAGLAQLRPDGRPRSVLVAGSGSATGCVADLLGAFGNGAVPVTRLRSTGAFASPAALSWTLPGWVGPLDLLLLATTDGMEPGLEALVEQAYRRGCTVVAVAPMGTLLAEVVGRTRGLAMPLAPRVSSPLPYGSGGGLDESGDLAEQPTVALDPSTLWALVTPLLALCDRLGLLTAPASAIDALAERLNQVAERCGPVTETTGNPAKTLAVELADALPLFWSEGPLAGAAGRHSVTTLSTLAGRPALAAELPEALVTHGALLTGAFGASDDPDDFFRDRVADPRAPQARMVLLREQVPGADSAVVAARDLAYAHGTPLSELEVEGGSGPLETAAELIATTDFAAVYLTLAAGEPS